MKMTFAIKKLNLNFWFEFDIEGNVRGCSQMTREGGRGQKV
jgi:hypothetical protein